MFCLCVCNVYKYCGTVCFFRAMCWVCLWLFLVFCLLVMLSCVGFGVFVYVCYGIWYLLMLLYCLDVFDFQVGGLFTMLSCFADGFMVG